MWPIRGLWRLRDRGDPPDRDRNESNLGLLVELRTRVDGGLCGHYVGNARLPAGHEAGLGRGRDLLSSPGGSERSIGPVHRAVNFSITGSAVTTFGPAFFDGFTGTVTGGTFQGNLTPAVIPLSGGGTLTLNEAPFVLVKKP
jgi:hypothetical protein